MSATNGRLGSSGFGDPVLDSPFLKEIHAFLLDGGIDPNESRNVDINSVSYRITVCLEEPRKNPDAKRLGGMSMIIKSVGRDDSPSVYGVIEVAMARIKKADSAALIEHLASQALLFLSPFRLGFFEHNGEIQVVLQVSFLVEGLASQYRAQLLEGSLFASRIEAKILIEKFVGVEVFFPAEPEAIAA